MLRYLAVAACAATTLGHALQGPRVAGSWIVTFDADISVRGEDVVVKRRGTGRLTLEQRGDSVFGTFKPDGLPDPERALTGAFDGKRLTLTTGLRRGKLQVNGQPTEKMMRTDWVGVVDAGGMRGTMLMQLGERQGVPRKWEAVRAAP